MKNFIVAMGLLLINNLLLLSCKKMEANPELRDPIYKDLTNIYQELEKKVKELEKNKEDNLKDLKKAGSNSLDLKVVRKKIKETDHQLTKTMQEREYLRIKVERRKIEGRKEYVLAFNKGEDWPKKDDYELYLTEKRLKTASRNWNDRITKNKNNKKNQNKDKQSKKED